VDLGVKTSVKLKAAQLLVRLVALSRVEVDLDVNTSVKLKATQLLARLVVLMKRVDVDLVNMKTSVKLEAAQLLVRLVALVEIGLYNFADIDTANTIII
jgi:hypothetical protein